VSLWTLLEAIIKQDVRKLQVMGDSKLVIEWAKHKANVHDVRLNPLLRDIKLSYQSFECLYFNHILLELNGKANDLSKEALQLPARAFGYYEFVAGEEKEAMEFRL